MSDTVAPFVAPEPVNSLVVDTKHECLMRFLVPQVHKLVSIPGLRWSNRKVFDLTHVGYCDFSKM